MFDISYVLGNLLNDIDDVIISYDKFLVCEDDN